MTQFSRRKLLSSLGCLGGATVLMGCGNQPGSVVSQAFGNAPNSPAPDSKPVWAYDRLEPQEIAARAYRMYPEGSCMYAVFGSVVSALAERFGEPYRFFPLEMMRFGAMGVEGWASLCGALNGAAALIGLFHSGKEKEPRELLVNELFTWYEESALPKFVPADAGETDEFPVAASGSIICHLSVSRWCDEAGYDAFSAPRRERCRRLSCDVAAKTVELLNIALPAKSMLAAGGSELGVLKESVQSCNSCHGRHELADAMVKMDCDRCHTFPGRHPE